MSDEMTSSERATYQSMRARGYSHEDALNDALDGVDVRDVRKQNLYCEDGVTPITRAHLTNVKNGAVEYDTDDGLDLS